MSVKTVFPGVACSHNKFNNNISNKANKNTITIMQKYMIHTQFPQ